MIIKPEKLMSVLTIGVTKNHISYLNGQKKRRSHDFILD